MKRKAYPSDLTGSQWNKINPLIPKEKSGGRHREQDMREIINAILYLSRTGCQWRYIPHDFPKWPTVYGYFRAWSKTETWEKIHNALRGEVRIKAGHDEQPSAGCIDSQSAKTTEQAHSDTKGYDVHKATKGRKRHILVDTMGLILKVIITGADVQDRDGAKLLLNKIKDFYSKLKHIWVDGAYAGDLIIWAKTMCGLVLEVVKRSGKGFEVLPRRWVVERTFGWLNRYRRLSKDYETLPDNSKSMIYVSMIHIMVRRLA